MSSVLYYSRCLLILVFTVIVSGIDGLSTHSSLEALASAGNLNRSRRGLSDLQLEVTFRDLPSEKGFLIGSSPSVLMNVELTNLGETAIIDPAILVSWWRLELIRVTPDDNSCSPFSEEHNLVTHKCQRGQSLQNGGSISFTFEYDMSTFIVSEQTIYEVMFNVTAISELDNNMGHSSESKSIMLPLYAEADLYMEGSSTDIKTFQEETEASPWKPSPHLTFHHHFQIALDGPSPIVNVIAVFQLPVNITTDPGNSDATMTLVHVRGLHKTGGREQLLCHPTKGHFSKSNTSGDDDEQYDNVEVEDPAFEVTGLQGGQAESNPMDKYSSKMTSSSLVKDGKLVMSCNSAFVSCMEVTCRINEYRAGMNVSLSFILDVEADLVEKLLGSYDDTTAILIESRGRITLPYVVADIQSSSSINRPDEAKVITVINGKVGLNKSKLSYILAIVIGIVVTLVLLILGVYAYIHLRRLLRRRKGSEEVMDAAEMNPLKMSDIPEATQTDYRI